MLVCIRVVYKHFSHFCSGLNIILSWLCSSFHATKLSMSNTLWLTLVIIDGLVWLLRVYFLIWHGGVEVFLLLLFERGKDLWSSFYDLICTFFCGLDIVSSSKVDGDRISGCYIMEISQVSFRCSYLFAISYIPLPKTHPGFLNWLLLSRNLLLLNPLLQIRLRNLLLNFRNLNIAWFSPMGGIPYILVPLMILQWHSF